MLNAKKRCRMQPFPKTLSKWKNLHVENVNKVSLRLFFDIKSQEWTPQIHPSMTRHRDALDLGATARHAKILVATPHCRSPSGNVIRCDNDVVSASIPCIGEMSYRINARDNPENVNTWGQRLPVVVIETKRMNASTRVLAKVYQYDCGNHCSCTSTNYRCVLLAGIMDVVTYCLLPWTT